MAKHNEIGACGERLAKRYLQHRFYHIAAANIPAPNGEIDLIAKKNGFLIFVEVKTRSSQNFRYGTPAAAVDRTKQVHLLSAAQYYLSTHKTKRKIRFDVIEVLLIPGKKPEINHIKDAFQKR